MSSRTEDILKSILEKEKYSGLPQSRVEELLIEVADLIESGGATPEQIEEAVDRYLDTHPVSPYDDTEIREEITSVKEDLSELDTEVQNYETRIKAIEEGGGSGIVDYIARQEINKLFITDSYTGNTVKIEGGSSSDYVNVASSGTDNVYISNDDVAIAYDNTTAVLLPYKVNNGDTVTFFIKDGSTLSNSVRVNFLDENKNIIDYWTTKTTRTLTYNNVKTAYYIKLNLNTPSGIVVRKGTSTELVENYSVIPVTSENVNLFDGNSFIYAEGNDILTVSKRITPKDYTDKKTEQINDNISVVDGKTISNAENIKKNTDEISTFYNYIEIPILLQNLGTTRPVIYGASVNLVGRFKVVVDDDLYFYHIKVRDGSIISDSGWQTNYTCDFEQGYINQFVFGKGDNKDQTMTIADKSKIHLFRVEDKLTDGIRDILIPTGVHYVGHAGADLSAPSNSVASFRIASSNNVLWGVETDLRETSDGVLVCIHDSDISITTNGTGNINEMTFADSQQFVIDVGSHIADYPNEKIPTLREYLIECRRNNKVPVMEVKTDVPINYETLVNTLKECGVNNNCIIQSFGYEVLIGCRANDFKGVCFLLITGSQKTESEMERIYAQVGLIGNCGLNAYTDCADVEHSNFLHNFGSLYGIWDTRVHDKNDMFGNMLCDIATISV